MSTLTVLTWVFSWVKEDPLIPDQLVIAGHNPDRFLKESSLASYLLFRQTLVDSCVHKTLLWLELERNNNKRSTTLVWSWFCKLGSVAGPVIQANGRLEFEDGLRTGVLLHCVSRWTSVRTKLGVNMDTLGEPGVARLSEEVRFRPGETSSSSKCSRRAVVGLRRWVHMLQQPDWHRQTKFFLCYYWICLLPLR